MTPVGVSHFASHMLDLLMMKGEGEVEPVCQRCRLQAAGGMTCGTYFVCSGERHDKSEFRLKRGVSAHPVNTQSDDLGTFAQLRTQKERDIYRCRAWRQMCSKYFSKQMYR